MATRKNRDRNSKGAAKPARKKAIKNAAGKAPVKKTAIGADPRRHKSAAMARIAPAERKTSIAAKADSSPQRANYANAGLDALRERLKQVRTKRGTKARNGVAKVDARVDATLHNLGENYRHMLD